MKKINQLTLASKLLFIGLFALPSMAQQAKIENIKILEGSGSVDNTGSFAIYQADGESGKMRNYTLKFFDFNYKEIASNTVELSKNTSITGSATNSECIAIAFGDLKEKQAFVFSFDKEGNQIGKIGLTGSAYPNTKVFRTPNGFILVNSVSKGMMDLKPTIELYGVDNSMKQVWKKVIANNQFLEVIDVVGTESDAVIVYTTGKGMKRENYKQHALRLTETGDQVFDVEFASNFYYFPNKILISGTNTYIFGSYPEAGKTRVEGIFALELDDKGTILHKKELSFPNELKSKIKELADSEDLNMKDNPQFIINDAIVTENGFYVIAETIRLSPAPGLSAEVSLNGGASGGGISVNTRFTMGDFLVINFNENLEFNDLKIVSKSKNSFVAEGIVPNVNQYYYQIKAQMLSNYRFNTTSQSGNPVMVYTIRQGIRSNVAVGVVDLSSENKVLKTNEMESDITKVKDLNYFNVIKNTGDNISIYMYKKGVLNLYNLKYTL